jgi:hypothetical protein
MAGSLGLNESTKDKFQVSHLTETGLECGDSHFSFSSLPFELIPYMKYDDGSLKIEGVP